MNKFNIITTYYNNKKHLENFVKGFKHHKRDYPFLKLYIIDDGSKDYPAKTFIDQQDDIELYEVTEDLGFNSHGCRNLGMTVSDKDWNLMLDSDINLKEVKLNILVSWMLDEKDVIDLSVNCLFVNKKTFFSCKGYDEELVNIHAGDRLLIEYFTKYFNFEPWDARRVNLTYNRNGRKLIISNNYNITTYDDKNGIYYGPYKTYKNLADLKVMIRERHEKNDFTEKKILNFPWIKVW